MAQVTIFTLQEREKILSAFLLRVGCRMLVTHTTSAIWKDQRPLIFRRKPLCSRDMCLLNHPAARWHSPTHFRDCWAYSKNASRHLPTRIFMANLRFLWGKMTLKFSLLLTWRRDPDTGVLPSNIQWDLIRRLWSQIFNFIKIILSSFLPRSTGPW